MCCSMAKFIVVWTSDSTKESWIPEWAIHMFIKLSFHIWFTNSIFSPSSAWAKTSTSSERYKKAIQRNKWWCSELRWVNSWWYKSEINSHSIIITLSTVKLDSERWMGEWWAQISFLALLGKSSQSLSHLSANGIFIENVNCNFFCSCAPPACVRRWIHASRIQLGLGQRAHVQFVIFLHFPPSRIWTDQTANPCCKKNQFRNLTLKTSLCFFVSTFIYIFRLNCELLSAIVHTIWATQPLDSDFYELYFFVKLHNMLLSVSFLLPFFFFFSYTRSFFRR